MKEITQKPKLELLNKNNVKVGTIVPTKPARNTFASIEILDPDTNEVIAYINGVSSQIFNPILKGLRSKGLTVQPRIPVQREHSIEEIQQMLTALQITSNIVVPKELDATL
jgi:hypothetical protein